MSKSLIAIDDQQEILDIVGRVARQLGFMTKTTTDAGDFKDMIRGKAPDVVLLDLQMPECDGVELLRFLFEQQCAAQIVLVSGVDAKVISVASHVGLELGLKMAKPLQKPLRIHELRDHLAQFLSVAGADIDADLLRRGLERDEIGLYFQPLVDLSRTRLVGWEALARWHQPELGLIGPDRFVPLVESSGLMASLTERVLTLAVGELAGWKSGPGRLAGTFVSVNFSATDLKDPHFPDRLEKLCAARGVPPDRLRLELTETAAMGETIRFVEVLTRLRVKGFKLSIDDFGTGYSSLVQLYRLPFSELKIDQTFVRSMAASEEAEIIVSAIVKLGHSLHLELIAEGVESAAIAEMLRGMSCEVGQGYYFSRPMPPADVAHWCRANPHLLAD